MDRPIMPPAHRDLPDDVTPPGHEPVKYVVGPGDLTRGELRSLLADAGAGAAELSNLSRDDLVSVAKARKLEGLEVSGTGAVEARARDFLRRGAGSQGRAALVDVVGPAPGVQVRTAAAAAGDAAVARLVL